MKKKGKGEFYSVLDALDKAEQMIAFIQPDLSFPVERSPIVVPQVGDRIVEIDTTRSIRREGIFVKEVQYLGATFWEVESGDRYLPRATKLQ